MIHFFQFLIIYYYQGLKWVLLVASRAQFPREIWGTTSTYLTAISDHAPPLGDPVPCRLWSGTTSSIGLFVPPRFRSWLDGVASTANQIKIMGFSNWWAPMIRLAMKIPSGPHFVKANILILNQCETKKEWQSVMSRLMTNCRVRFKRVSDASGFGLTTYWVHMHLCVGCGFGSETLVDDGFISILRS